MDWIEVRQKGREFWKKYRYVLIVFLAGMFLMLLPEKNTSVQAAPIAVSDSKIETKPDLQDSLGDLLSKIEGAGKVQVLLTEAAGQRTHYQTDENVSTGESSSDVRRDTVVVSDGSRTETGLVRQIDPPVYMGAVVLCQGADSAAVRLAIVEAVANATGLSSDKISVLKMKA